MALTFKGISKCKDKNEENPPTDTSNAFDSSFKLQSDRLRWSFEDPMHSYLKLQRIKDKEERVRELQQMLESSSSSSESSSDSDSSASSDLSHRKRKWRKHYSGSSSSSTDDSHRKKKWRKYSATSFNTGSDNSNRKKKHREKSSTDSDSSLDHSHRKQKKSEKEPISSERKERHKNDWKDSCTKGKNSNKESLDQSDRESVLKHRNIIDCDDCRISDRKKKHKRRKSKHSDSTAVAETGKHARDSCYTDNDRNKHTKHKKHKKKKRKK